MLLPLPVGAQNQSVAQIALVQIQAIRRIAISGQNGQASGLRRIVGTRVACMACPGAGQKQKVRQVQGIDDRSADIGPVVARNRAQ